MSALFTGRGWQMFCCSVVPENNSLVWEEPSILLDQEQAASPRSINSSASSSSLHLCCWVVCSNCRWEPGNRFLLSG